MAEDIIVDDFDATYVQYLPPGNWRSYNISNRTYHDHTYHNTNLSGAYATFKFTGSYVAYISDRYTDHGAFNVSIDNGTAVQLSSYGADLTENITMFSTEVSYGMHTLTVMNIEPSRVVGVDYFVYRTSTSATISPSTTDTPWPSTEPLGSSLGTSAGTARGGGGVMLDPAAIAGVTFGALASALMLVMIAFVVKRRCSERRRWPKVGGPRNQQIRAWRKHCTA